MIKKDVEENPDNTALDTNQGKSFKDYLFCLPDIQDLDLRRHSCIESEKSATCQTGS